MNEEYGNGLWRSRMLYIDPDLAAKLLRVCEVAGVEFVMEGDGGTNVRLKHGDRP